MMDEWELLNTEDGLALLERMSAASASVQCGLPDCYVA